MQHDEFIGLVQQRARMGSRGDAEQATRATLTALAERLAPGLPSNIADQLPPEIGRHLSQNEDRTDRFDIGEFYDRVEEEETSGVDRADAALHARAVLSVVADAIDDSLFGKLEEQLPPELGELLEFGDLREGTE